MAIMRDGKPALKDTVEKTETGYFIRFEGKEINIPKALVKNYEEKQYANRPAKLVRITLSTTVSLTSE